MEADQADSWASASSHVSCWSRDDDSLSFESLSVTSLQGSDVQQTHSILSDGLQTVQQYEHPTIIRHVTVNHFNNWLFILDDSGVVKWNHDNHRSFRVFQFPRYKHKLYSNIIYSDYYNVYFVLTTSGKVKVLNKDFSDVHTLELPAEQAKVSCIAFNDRTYQLVTGGLGGIKIFNYCQQQVNWKVIKPMAQYSLVLSNMSVYTKGVWIRRVTVSSTMDWLLGMSGCDVLIYTFSGTLLLHMKRLHQDHVTSCIFVPLVKYYITSSEDASIKVWSESCSLITTFTGHLKEVTAMLVHPHCQWLIITCSLDGTIKQWNLLTLQMEHSLTSTIGGAREMAIVNKNCFYVMSNSTIELVEFNFITQFWALGYCKMSKLGLVLRESKSPQLLARGVDGSVRLYSSDSTHLTTVLPCHQSSSVTSVAYCNDCHTLCTLNTDNELWLYSTRYNPARRIIVASGDQYITVETLLLSVPPTTIRLHHKPQITDITSCGSLLLLGMLDGRVVILEPRKDELKSIGYLQAFISPVILLKFDRVLNTLMCASNYADDVIHVQLWNVINWSLSATVQCDYKASLVDCAMLESSIMTGHSNGTVSLFRLNDSSSLNTLHDSEELDEANGGIISVQSSHSYSLFSTTHSSNVLRLWNDHFILLLEISMCTTLCAGCFLPGQACLILSLHNHLYKLMLDNVLPHTIMMLQKETMETATTAKDTNSMIIDDLTGSPDPLALQQHSAAVVAMTTSQTATQQSDGNSINDNESILSAAATETYQSPSVTPLSSMWLFPSVGPPSPTSSYGDISCDPVSLMHTVEESHRGYSPNKESVQNQVIVTSLNDDITDDVNNNQQSTITDPSQEDGINLKVTKVTRSKLQGMTIPDDREVIKSKLIVKNSRSSNKPQQHKIGKTKVTKTVNTYGTGVVNNKPVAVECDTEMVTTSTLNKVLEVTKQLNLSLSTWPVDALEDRASLVTDDVFSSVSNISKADRPSSKADKLSLRADRPSSKTDKVTSKADRPSSKAGKISSKADRPSSKADKVTSKADRPSSKADRPSSKAGKISSKAGRVSSEDNAMTSNDPDNRIISVIVNKKSSHDRKSRSPDHSVESSPDRKSRSPDHSVTVNDTVLGWQLNAIERANWRSSIQIKRHEDAQLRRLQRDYDRRLVKSASHLKCFPQTNSKWRQQQYSIERVQSAGSSSAVLSDITIAVDPHNSFHEHKLNCSEYRLQLYEHEK